MSSTPKVMQSYNMWVAITQPDAWEMTRLRHEATRFAYRPLVSILLPVYNPKRAWLERALDSVLAQAYPDWELCVCDDGSTEGHVREVLDLYGRLDRRIKVKYLESNENIVGATNHALSLAEGEYVGLLDHDDEMAPNALFEVVRFLQERPDADLLYSDEDKIDEGSKRAHPHFKVGWSHDLAMEANYLCHFSVYRRSILEEVGGWREGFDGAQDLELVQRIGERTDRIHHIPKILYHWRMVAGSTAMGAAGKPYTHERARRAIEESLRRQGIAGTVEDSGFMPNTFRVRREITGEPRVSVILPTTGEPIVEYVESLRRLTSYPNYEIIVADVEKGVLTEYPESGEPRPLKHGAPPSLSKLYNAAVRRTEGEYVAILDPDLEAATEGWLESLLQQAQRPEVGAAGGKLVLPSGTTLQAGLILKDGEGEGRPRFYRNCDPEAMGYGLFFALNRNCSAVSSSCMMFRRSVFEEVGGFDDARFEAEFADVDLCLRMQENGYRIVCTPYAAFVRHGSPDLPADLGPAQAAYVRERWGHVIKEDPYYNRNLAWDPDELTEIRGRPLYPDTRDDQPDDGEDATPDTDVGAAPAPPVRVEDAADASAPSWAQEGRGTPMKLPPPFFVVGHGRSGTTWLELTLNSHPEVACKGSGMFFGREGTSFEALRTLPTALSSCENLRTWHDMRPNYWTKGRTFEEDLPGMTKAVTDHVLYTALAQSGKRIVGDRTPHHVTCLEEIHELYPHSKVIHIVRDGRDVAVSNMHAFWSNALDKGGSTELEPEELELRDAYLEDREGFLKSGRSIFTEARITQLARIWNHMVRKGRNNGRQLFGAHYVEVCYEDLLDDPRPELERLFESLGVDRSPEVIDRIVEENRFEKVAGRPRGEEDPASFHRKGVSGDWKEVFTERDRSIFEREAGEMLAEFGYEPEGAAARDPGGVEGPAEASREAASPSTPVSGARISRADPPFFVVGHGRSGTTWSERLLNSHPEVLCKGSGMFFGRDMKLFEGRTTLYATLANAENLRLWHDMQANYWSARPFEEDLPGMVKAITDHVLYTELEKSGKRIVGDRTPHHVTWLEEIHELYPDSKVVHIIRDGRDVAVSNMHAFWNSARDRGGPIDLKPEELERRDAYLEDREGFLARGESIFTESKINELSKGWNYVVSRGRNNGRKFFGENYLEIRYERLLDNPHPELERLFGFLDASKDAATIGQIVEENRFEKRSAGRSRGEEDTTSFFRKGIHGDWKNVFNERDRRVFKERAGGLLVELGYEKDMNW